MADFATTPFSPVNLTAPNLVGIGSALNSAHAYLAACLENNFTHDDYTDAEADAQLKIEIDLVRQRVNQILAVVLPTIDEASQGRLHLAVSIPRRFFLNSPASTAASPE
jgi:hypothetical protein